MKLAGQFPPATRSEIIQGRLGLILSIAESKQSDFP